MNDDVKKPNDPTQDPLAVLENILKDAKGKSGTSKDSNLGNVPDPATVKLAEAENQALADKKIQEAKALELVNQEKIEQYRQQMKGEIQKTDAYQARLSQDKDDQKDKDTAASTDGFDIKQLEHKKI